MQKRIPVNNQIRAREVRVIDETGKQLGVFDIAHALALAREKSLDLIQVTEKVEPPVCKIGDFGKYLYLQEKRGRETRKHEVGQLKEIRLTFNISQNDLATRARQANKFLVRGDKVRVVLRLRGREKALEGFAREKVGKFLGLVKESMDFKIERELKREGGGLIMMISK